MKLYINGRFLTQNITGVQRYAMEVVKQIDQMALEDEIILLVPKNTIQQLSLNHIKIKQIGKLKGHRWEQISLPIYLFGKKATLLNLCNLGPVLHPGYVTLHDIAFKTAREHLDPKFSLVYRFITRCNSKRYRHIFTVSEFSKKEILSQYPVKPEKVTVTYTSAEHIRAIQPDNSILEKYHLIQQGYYFSLGSNSPHKNRKYVIECAKRNPEETFVITGNSNHVFQNEELEKPKNVIFTGYLSDEEIVALYKHAKAFLFPSTYEGFGVPPIEAMEAGCKTVYLSNIPVFKELYGNSVSYIELESKDCYQLPKEESKEKEIQEILQRYSWKKVANKIIEKIKERK